MTLTPSATAFQAHVLDTAEDGVLWAVADALEGTEGQPLAAQRALDDTIFPLLRKLPEAAADLYVKEIAKRSGVSIAVLKKGVFGGESEAKKGVRFEKTEASKAEPAKGGGGISDEDNQRLVDWIQKLNEKHFIIPLGGKTMVGTLKHDMEIGRERIDFGTFQDQHKLYSHIHVWVPTGRKGKRLEEVGKVWTSHPSALRYEDIVFAPGRTLPPEYLNLWRGFAVDPRPGDCAQYWDLCRNGICAGNEDHYQWVRKWQAFGVQKLDRIPGSSIVMRGLEGTGKNAFVGWFGHLFGRHYLPITAMEHLSGRFNAHLRDVLVLFLNEALWGGDKNRIGNVKAHVTDDLLTSESKGVDARAIKNFKRVLVAANEDWAVPRGMDDRRWFVLDVSPVYKENTGYFAELETRMLHGGGLEALLWDLQHEDLTGFNPRNTPDGGANGFDMKIRGANSVVQWWQELLYRGVNTGHDEKNPVWLHEIAIDELYQNYRTWNERLQKKHIEIRVIWAREIRKLVPHIKIEQSRVDGRRRKYVLGDLKTCRDAFQKTAKSGTELWDEDTTEEKAEWYEREGMAF